MTWWTSIVSYLWRNSLRRWCEQPLGVISKIVVAALVGGLGAGMMVAMAYIGSEINEQLMSRDAMKVQIREYVTPALSAMVLEDSEEEEEGWRSLSRECLVLYRVSALVATDGRNRAPFYLVRDPEAMGYPDTLVYVTSRLPEGLMVTASFRDIQAEALVLPANEQLAGHMPAGDEMLLGGLERFRPLLGRGFTAELTMRASSVEDMAQADKVVRIMNTQDGRQIQMWSALPLLIKLSEVRAMQGYIAIISMVGSALTLGLTFGALAWMEFREERYLLSLVRSFGVGRRMLFCHAMLENCLVAVLGTLLGVGALAGLGSILNDGIVNFKWMELSHLMDGAIMGILICGALLGGVLSSIPVAIGLRRPLGLTLK